MKKVTILILLLSVLTQVFGQSWNMVWSDEFNYAGLPDNTKWGNELRGNANQELQYYTFKRLENSKVEYGNLLIIAKKESYLDSSYTSARITTEGKFYFTYGKIEARIKTPTGQGIWPAFWMLGKNMSQVGWPACGEVDIMEQINSEGKNHGTMHWDKNGHSKYGGTVVCSVNQFHVYSIEWTVNSIKWFLDGNKYWEGNIKDSINSTGEFHKPFYLILNLAIGGSWPGNPNSSTIFPDTMSVDYVRVYKDVSTKTENVFAPLDFTIQLTPNPTTDFISIDIPQYYCKGNLSIFDMNGIEMIVKQIEAENTRLYIGHLSKGLYLLKYTNNLLSITKKIIKS